MHPWNASRPPKVCFKYSGDMSAAWPARKPTAHRAKCDQLVAHLDALVSDLQATKAKLAKTQSLLEAHAPGTVEDDEAELVDCFVPRYVEEEWDREWDDDFELKDDLIKDASSRAVDESVSTPPVRSIAPALPTAPGSTSIVDDRET